MPQFSRVENWLRRVKQGGSDLTQKKQRQRNVGPVSTDYVLIEREDAVRQRVDGWQARTVAERQDVAFQALIQKMYAGQSREDLLAAAESVRCTGLPDPLILEVGCGSGYYSEILSYLLQRPVRYVGVDYSPAMIRLAGDRYPDRPFVVGDATALPFPDGAFDILLNGVSLMHILDYEAAIAEHRRLASGWCIFHTVPVRQHGDTTVLRKQAYGEWTVELIFNEAELRRLLQQSGLVVRSVLDSIPYNVESVLGEPTTTKTFVCEVAKC